MHRPSSSPSARNGAAMYHSDGIALRGTTAAQPGRPSPRVSGGSAAVASARPHHRMVHAGQGLDIFALPCGSTLPLLLYERRKTGVEGEGAAIGAGRASHGLQRRAQHWVMRHCIRANHSLLRHTKHQFPAPEALGGEEAATTVPRLAHNRPRRTPSGGSTSKRLQRRDRGCAQVQEQGGHKRAPPPHGGAHCLAAKLKP